MTNMLLSNGYPKETLKRARSKATTRPMSHQCHQNNSPKGVLPLPYISDVILHQVRRVTRGFGFDLYIAHKSGPTLRSALTRSALERPPCPGQKDCLACQAGLQGRCATKNVVYRLECALCSECYIGETKRPIRERFMEHRRAARSRDTQNPWGAHYTTSHKDDPTPNVPLQQRL